MGRADDILVAKVTSLFRGFQVQDILNCIQRKARGVEAYAKTLEDGFVVKNYLVTKEVQKTTATTQVQVDEIHGRCQEIGSNIVELKGFITEQINDALASKNGMFQMLKDVVSGK
jgi:hypothetical protein